MEFYSQLRSQEIGPRGQFHETKLSLNSPEVWCNLHHAGKTMGNFELKFREIYAGWSFPLNCCLMKIGPRGQFQETKLSVESRGNRHSAKYMEKASIKLQRNSAMWRFPLNFCLMKLTHFDFPEADLVWSHP